MFPKPTALFIETFRGPRFVALRNRLMHGYDAVDFDILWQILADDVPPLVAALEKALSEETYSE